MTRNILISMLVTLAVAGTSRAGELERSRQEPPSRDQAALLQAALDSGERFWKRIEYEDPYPSLSCRGLLSYAQTLCAARQHAERLPRLFELAAQMQDRDAASKGYGNFRWYWRDAEVTDTNAVEFCSYDTNLMWRLHRQGLPEPMREALRELLRYGLEGCLRHRVRPSYTNIAVLNAANLIALGEAFERPDAADEGYRRLEALALETWQNGLHEYCSPTYYAVDLEGLEFCERFAQREAGRRLAQTLLELLWTDLAVNWFPPAGRLAGPHSRSYDYLHGLGGLQQNLAWHGWLNLPPKPSTEALHVAQGRWDPPAALLDLSRTRFPRLVRQAWGPRPAESRTHWLLADVTLGCSGALYGAQDAPLTFDLAGPATAVRGYFIPDGREDPYGQKKYDTGPAKHPKALHLEPFWAGAQRKADALGLVLYRDQDLRGEQVVNLQSHFVLPRDVDGVWLRGRPLKWTPATPDSPVRFAVAAGEPLVVQKGSAAVGLRLVWSRARDGRQAEAALVDDGNRLGALRLTVEHGRTAGQTQAGAAFWVRIGGGLDSAEALRRWREEFSGSACGTAEVSADRIHVQVPGREGEVSLAAAAPFGSGGAVRLEPQPTRAVLEVDGQDIGRRLFQAVEPFRTYNQALAPERIIRVPAEGGVRWEAESGLVLPGMAAGNDAAALGGRYVWQPAAEGAPRPAGSVTWRLEVARAGRYWLWGRVLAPDPEHDSFLLMATGGQDQTLVQGAWHTPRGPTWHWAAVALERAQTPTPLDLPAGAVQLRILPREAGTGLDALWLTPDAAARPE